MEQNRILCTGKSKTDTNDVIETSIGRNQTATTLRWQFAKLRVWHHAEEFAKKKKNGEKPPWHVVTNGHSMVIDELTWMDFCYESPASFCPHNDKIEKKNRQ